jgi:hypothetical protein
MLIIQQLASQKPTSWDQVALEIAEEIVKYLDGYSLDQSFAWTVPSPECARDVLSIRQTCRVFRNATIQQYVKILSDQVQTLTPGGLEYLLYISQIEDISKRVTTLTFGPECFLPLVGQFKKSMLMVDSSSGQLTVNRKKQTRSSRRGAFYKAYIKSSDYQLRFWSQGKDIQMLSAIFANFEQLTKVRFSLTRTLWRKADLKMFQNRVLESLYKLGLTNEQICHHLNSLTESRYDSYININRTYAVLLKALENSNKTLDAFYGSVKNSLTDVLFAVPSMGTAFNTAIFSNLTTLYWDMPTLVHIIDRSSTNALKDIILATTNTLKRLHIIAKDSAWRINLSDFAEELDQGPQLELLDLENVFMDEDTFIELIPHSLRKLRMADSSVSIFTKAPRNPWEIWPKLIELVVTKRQFQVLKLEFFDPRMEQVDFDGMSAHVPLLIVLKKYKPIPEGYSVWKSGNAMEDWAHNEELCSVFERGRFGLPLRPADPNLQDSYLMGYD